MSSSSEIVCTVLKNASKYTKLDLFRRMGRPTRDERWDSFPHDISKGEHVPSTANMC